ncbi:hypothetical protein ACFRMQ_26690 [Kitasatospora sp. NPDC056783]|uniref:hypothetical protein n=1 Tax=Kitasatospora sp. NPDC056783 TaxID=3345943 RepID=UPI0036A3B339
MRSHLIEWVYDVAKDFEFAKYFGGAKYLMIALLVVLPLIYLVGRPSQPPKKPSQGKSVQVTRQHHAPKGKDPVRALVDGEIGLSVDSVDLAGHGRSAPSLGRVAAEDPADALSTQLGKRDADLARMVDDEGMPTASRHLAEGLDELFRALGPPPAPRPGDTDVVLVGDGGGQQ